MASSCPCLESSSGSSSSRDIEMANRSLLCYCCCDNLIDTLLPFVFVCRTRGRCSGDYDDVPHSAGTKSGRTWVSFFIVFSAVLLSRVIYLSNLKGISKGTTESQSIEGRMGFVMLFVLSFPVGLHKPPYCHHFKDSPSTFLPELSIWATSHFDSSLTFLEICVAFTSFCQAISLQSYLIPNLAPSVISKSLSLFALAIPPIPPQLTGLFIANFCGCPCCWPYKEVLLAKQHCCSAGVSD